ncbi:MAG: SCO family protein [Gammaproteobacteria bacterium]|nr:SCO family protein [Gammaproteobacteria bacterium]
MISRLLIIAALLLTTACADDAHDWHAKSISGLMPPLEFTLTDENGNTVTAEGFRGDIVLLFFGFTHCPDFCPTTLSKLSRALADLGDARTDVTVLFVSVDPKRDGPEALRRYTSSFAPEIVGLTGTMDQLESLAKRYRTTFSYGAPDDAGYYSVSHGLAVYVFDPGGKARLMILNDAPVDEIASDLRTLADRP